MDERQEKLYDLLERTQSEAYNMADQAGEGRAVVHALYGHGFVLMQVIGRLRDIEDATTKAQVEIVRELRKLANLIITSGIIIILLLIFGKLH